MKLTIEHIQNYGNSLFWINTKSGRIIKPNFYLEENGFLNLYDPTYILDIWPFKPILRKLDHYKDITSDAFVELNTDLSTALEIQNLANHQVGLSNVSYGAIMEMQREKIDYMRLCDAGLAIDADTLETNPYNN